MCGNGTIEGMETCDDNNTMNGDGCSNFCMIEPGFNCTNEPSNCITMCGDGITAGVEQCDDGNLNPNDGCTDTCQVILLDLNVPDNTTLDYSDEYFETDQVVFLFDPNNTNFSTFFLLPDRRVSKFYLVLYY